MPDKKQDDNDWDRAADEIARLWAENASLTAEVMHLRGKLDHIAQCARWDLEPCAWPREHGKTGSPSNDTVIIITD